MLMIYTLYTLMTPFLMALLSSRLFVHLLRDTHKHVQKLTSLCLPLPPSLSPVSETEPPRTRSPYPQRRQGRKFRLRLLARPPQGHPRPSRPSSLGAVSAKPSAAGPGALGCSGPFQSPFHPAGFRFPVASLASPRASGLYALR